MRNTPQRAKILEYLKSVRTHPTAEQVYKAVKKNMPSITLATVYRNLNLLAEKGDILRLEINHEYHYDGFSHDHIHFVCENTKKIYDIDDKEVLKFIMKRLGKNFIPSNVDVIIRGECNVHN